MISVRDIPNKLTISFLVYHRFTSVLFIRF